MAGTACRHGGTLRPMQLNTHCNNHMAWQKSRGISVRLARYHPFGEGHEQARSEHKEKPDNTQSKTTVQYTHSTLLKSSNRPMADARRRQGQQLYAWHGTPSRRPQVAPPFLLTPAGEAIQPQPPAFPPEAWPSECDTNKANSQREIGLPEHNSLLRSMAPIC